MHSLPTIPAHGSDGSTCSNDSDSPGSLPAAAAATACPAAVRNGSNSNGNSLARQQSLPPLPEQRAVAQQHAGLDSLKQQQQQQQQQQQTVGRRNPFAAASAAAAVHEAIGGCVAAVDADVAAGCADVHHSCSIRDQDKLPRSHSSSSSSNKGASKLIGSQSVMPTASKPSSSSSSKAAGAAGDVLVQRAFLPHLQQLQLKHCSLMGVTLDDVITKPLVSPLLLLHCKQCSLVGATLNDVITKPHTPLPTHRMYLLLGFVTPELDAAAKPRC
jgi:hypothetical protein